MKREEVGKSFKWFFLETAPAELGGPLSRVCAFQAPALPWHLPTFNYKGLPLPEDRV